MKSIVSLYVLVLLAFFFTMPAWGEVASSESQKIHCRFQNNTYICVPKEEDSYILYDEQGEKWGTFYRLRPFLNTPYPEIMNNLPLEYNVRCFAIAYETGESVFVGSASDTNELCDVLRLVSEKKFDRYELSIFSFTLCREELKTLSKFHFDCLTFGKVSFPSNIPAEWTPNCRHLSLIATAVPPDFFKNLSENRTLTGLTIIVFPFGLKDADIVDISKIRSLRTLSLVYAWKEHLCLLPLIELPDLEVLELKGDLEILDLRFVSKMPSLKDFNGANPY